MFQISLLEKASAESQVRNILIEEIKFRLARPDEYESLYDDFITPYFPEDEVKPLFVIERMYREGYYQIYLLTDSQGEVLAVACLAGAPDCRMLLLDYFAVREDVRDQGLGSAMLKALYTEYASKGGILVETETTDSAANECELLERIRRNAFYERNGVHLCGYRTWIYGVVFDIRLLGNPEKISREDNQKAMEQIYRCIVPKHRYDNYVRIPYQGEAIEFVWLDD